MRLRPSNDIEILYKSEASFLAAIFESIVQDFNKFITESGAELTQKDYDIHFVVFLDGNLNAIDRESATFNKLRSAFTNARGN